MAPASRAPSIENMGRTLIVGLGNPGPKYRSTRHNVGCMVIEELARRWNISMSRQRFDSFFGDGLANRKRVVVLAPQTFMNLSGRAVSPAFRFFDLEPGALIVVHDEIEIPFGRVRIKWAGGNAGHNGLRSIDKEFGTRDYFRVRVGVGRPQVGSVTDHVLSRFLAREEAALADVVAAGTDAIELLLQGGLKAAQNELNGRTLYEAPKEDQGA